MKKYTIILYAAFFSIILFSACADTNDEKNNSTGNSGKSIVKGDNKMVNDTYATDETRETATFAAGCFWGVQHILDEIPGVIETTVGYTGGTLDNPTYRDVTSSRSGHAEALQVVFNPQIISFEELIGYFWRLHDPTQLNRQGPDVGTQYRSAIFYYSEQQREIAKRSMAAFDESKVFKRKAVSLIVPATEFFPAEDYHQKYFDKNGGSSCHFLRPR